MSSSRYLDVISEGGFLHVFTIFALFTFITINVNTIICTFVLSEILDMREFVISAQLVAHTFQLLTISIPIAFLCWSVGFLIWKISIRPLQS
jgi:hypothetical protein